MVTVSPAMVAGPLKMLNVTDCPLAPPVAETANGASPNVFPSSGPNVMLCGMVTAVMLTLRSSSKNRFPAPLSVARMRMA